MSRPLQFLKPVFLAVLPTALMASPCAAQLHDWSAIPLSPTAAVALEQSWASVLDGNSLKIFSCFTRNWSALITTFGAPAIEVCNEHIIAKDGPVFYGYSSRTGRFIAQMTFTPGAVVLRRVSPQSWLSLVVDGNFVHVFQAIEGVWTTHAFSQPPVVTLGTKCALVQDGSLLFGVSAFYGNMVPLAIPGGVGLGAFGNCGIAQSPGMVHGFSAYRNTWASHPMTAAPTVSSGHTQAAFALLQEGTNLVFFSGHTGTFTPLPQLQAPAAQLDRAVGVVLDGTTIYGYSGLLGKVDSRVMAAAPIVVKQQWFALLEAGNQVTAFSATTGTFSKSIAATTAEITTKAETALYTPASASTPAYAYSQFLNLWTPAPALAASTAFQTATSVILVEPSGGLHALSARKTTWNYRPTPVIDEVFVGTNNPKLEQTFLARSGLHIWAFNPRTDKWREVVTAAPATAFSGNSSALIAMDGVKAYGFSNWSDRWSVEPLAGPPVKYATQVQSAWVDDGASVHVYSAVGQMSTSNDYPEYWRAASLGTRVRVDLAAEPGSIGVLALGLTPAEIPLGVHGTLLIDPALMFLLGMPTLPQVGTFGLRLQVPLDPAFSGLDLFFQSFVVLPTTFYLTNAIAVRAL